MSSVDDRIVNMQFNNRQFEAGAAQSSATLGKLNQTLAGTASGTGLSTMSRGIEDVKAHFSALQVAGVSAIATLASKATTFGIGLIKSFTLDPVTQGFQEYQTELNSIQTIMANTGAKINVVNKYLGNLNHYADQTIYDFGQMASAIGKFTAAGVPLNQATSAIKGMGNSAALSGASVDQLNNAMYQVSQALASGTIRLMDWNSLVNANMGGTNMQKSLEATAHSMKDGGASMDSAMASAGNFRDSLQAGWLTADIFNKTMVVMAGTTDKATGKTVAYSVAQLKAKGYTAEAAKQLHILSGNAIDAATKVKTFPQMLDVIKESIGSGWSKIFQDIFGNFNQSVKMWTSVTTSITNVIGTFFGKIDKMLVGWRKLGGYAELWAGFGNIFKALGNIIHPFVAAFQALSPGTSKAGSSLEKLTHGFQTVTGWLVTVTKGFDKFTPILVKMASGVHYLFSFIGKLIDAAKQLAPVFDAVGKAASGMLDKGIHLGQNLIDGIMQGINVAGLEQKIVTFANGIVDWFKNTLGIHSPATELIPVGLNIVEGIATGIGHGLVTIVKSLGTVIEAIFHEIGQLFAGFDAMDWASLFNALFTGGLLYNLNRMTKAMSGVASSISGTIGQLGNTLSTFQNSVRAKMILDIAIAVGILVASIIALSFLKPKEIAVSLGAIASMMSMLAGAMLAFSKINASIKFAASLAIISVALLSLSGVIAALGSLPMSTVAQGLGAVAAMLAMLTASMLALSKIPPGSIEGVAASMLVMALSMSILVTAVLAFGHMDMKTLAKGLGSVGVALALFTLTLLALSSMSGSIEGAAGAILIMATAMVVLATAVFAFGHMDMKTLAKGFAAVGIALALMVGAILLLSENSVGVLAAGAAMVLMATAMNLLLGVIITLGAAPWQVVARGLGFVAAALAIFLLAGAAAMYVGPGLEALGTSVLLMGAGMLAAGVGMSLFAAGLAVLATVGTAATAVITSAILSMIALFPQIAEAMAGAVIAFIKVIANASGEIRKAFDKIFQNILGVISDNIKPLGNLLKKFIGEGIKVLESMYSDIIHAGLKLINDFLDAIDKNITPIINKGTDIMVKLIKGMGSSASRIINALADAIYNFLKALDKTIVDNTKRFQDVGMSIAGHILDGMSFGLAGKIKGLFSGAFHSLGGVFGSVWDKVSGGDMINGQRQNPSQPADFEAASHADSTALKWGNLIAKGIGNSIKVAVGSAIELINAAIAGGNALVAKAENQGTKAQIKADAADAKAKLAAKQAAADAKVANQHQKNKADQKKARISQNRSDKRQRAADKAQARADAAAQKIQDAQAFADADKQGKGDIKTTEAKALSDRANKLLATANAEATAAKKLQGQARKHMLDRARKDADDARKIAKRSKDTTKQAADYYAGAVTDRINEMKRERAADLKTKRDQAAYDAATDQGKVDIMKNRAAADQKLADTANANARKLIEQAKKLSKTDAKKAQQLLDKADAQTQIAKDAASSAKDEADQAKQLKDQIAQGIPTDSGSGGPSTPPIYISRSVLEDAASSVDRYSKSLKQAEIAAANDQPVVQFTQYNTSPEALSPSTVFRQTKNLLSAHQLKMGSNTN